jgi:hypothetical protein
MFYTNEDNSIKSNIPQRIVENQEKKNSFPSKTIFQINFVGKKSLLRLVFAKNNKGILSFL